MNLSRDPEIKDENGNVAVNTTNDIVDKSLNAFSNKKIKNNNININNMKNCFIEKYDKKNIEYLLSLEPEEFLYLVYDSTETNEEGNKWNAKDYIKYIRKLLINIYENDNEIKCFYKQRSNNRLYCAKSGQALQHKIRGFLLKHTIDYDMINAHPTLLLYLANKYGVYCANLTSYCNNRNDFLEKSGLTKYDILKAINKDKNRLIKGNFLYNGLIQELELIKDTINKKINISTENEKNPISSKINKLLCYYENEILNKVIEKYHDQISVLMFDGFMANGNIPIDELNKISEEYGILWKIKEHDNSITIPDDFEPIDLPLYSYQKKKFEENVFLVKKQRLYFQNLGNDEIQQINRNDLKDYAEEYQIINENGKKSSIFQKWLADKDKKQYEDLVFDPSETIDTKKYLNTFTGFACKEWNDNNNKNIDSFHKLINNLCNHEQNVIEYILNYLAHIIQKPAEKSGKIIVFRGIEGIGKDSFHLLIEKILGSKYCLNTENFEEIFGRFNMAIKDKIFITLNETNAQDGLKYKDSLKAFATAQKTKYADKCIKSVEQNNYSRLFLFTNASSPVNIEMTSRRYIVIKTGWDLVNKTEYWNDFYKNLNDKEYIKSVYNFLKNRPISNFKINNIPITEEYKTMKENTVHPVIEYIKELFNNDKLLFNFTYDDTLKAHTIKRVDFIQEFEDYLEINHEYSENLTKKKVITNALKDIGGICPDKQIKRDGKNSRVMVFDFIKIKKFYSQTKLL